MLTLRTLGGVYIADEQGQPLTGAAGQRRLLALLVVLAVAGDRGLSRDKLIAILWPEAEEDRARHSLTQALYAARRALGAEDLFDGRDDIRLNRERLHSDVRELTEALDAGDDERAVALYTGAFADGFYLPGAGEFEQWTAGERGRLEDRIVGALERLADRAESGGRPREALGWRKRLTTIRPLDASAAVALMASLASAGDRAGALQHARLHETLLREELGLDPDPVVASLAARLREPVDWTVGPALSSGGDPVLTGPPNPAGTGGAALGTLDDEAPAQATAPIGGHSRWVRARAWWIVAGASVAVGVAALLRPKAATTPSAPPPAPLEQSVVVAPFRVAGASGSLAYLREGMVELLSTRLADDSDSRSVDAGAVLAAWRAADLGNPTDVPRGVLVRLAARLGAERVVIGNIVGTPTRMVISASVVDVGSQWTSAEATVEGPADSITALVDRLAARLLVFGAGEEVTLSEQTTQSLRGLRAYLAGQAAFRRGSYLLAVRQYGEALRADSAFALAAVQLARTAARLRLVEPRTRALALAWRERDALDARARALLLALAGPDYPAPSDAADQVAAWERLVNLTPARAETWFELGDLLAMEGAASGVVDARARARVVLRRALRLDSTYAPSSELLSQLEAAAPRHAGRPGAGLAVAPDSALTLAPFLQWRAAVVAGDSGALRELRARFGRLGPRNLRAIAVASQVEGLSPGDARRAVQQLRARATRLDDQIDAVLADHALALNQGRLRDAQDATARLAELQPGSRAHVRLPVLDALYGGGSTATADSAADALRRSLARRATTDPAARAVDLADACVLAQWRLQQNDTTDVRGTIERLRADSLAAGLLAPPIASGTLACAELLHAWLAVVLGLPGAGLAVAHLDSLAFTAGSSGDAISYAPLLIGRLHDRLGDPRAALAAVRRREDEIGWPRYLATTWREEGRYAVLAGSPDEARKAFRRYLVLRAQPDPELLHEVERVRGELASAGDSIPGRMR